MSSRVRSRNAFETSLAGALGAGATSVDLLSASGLTGPGYLVIEPESPAMREYIRFTGVSTNTLTGVTRGLDGSAGGAQAHDSGRIVRAVAVHQWLDLIFDDIEATETDVADHLGGTSIADHPEATTSVRGFMSAADKTKLDGIDPEAEADHAGLTGLTNDDHPQYLPLSGVRQMTGDLDMGAQDIVDVALVDGIDVATLGAQALRLDHTAEISGLTGKTTPVAADVFLIEDSAAANAKKKVTFANLAAAVAPTDGFRFLETVNHPGGLFTKADYPGLTAIRVRMVGGGGAGGGATTTGAGVSSFGNGGNGGSYAEAWILAADLAATEAVVVGSGGTPAAGAAGGDGTASVFDTISGEVRAAGGVGGATGSGSAVAGVGSPGTNAASTGDLTIHGGQMTSGQRPAGGVEGGWGGPGGSSQFAPPTPMRAGAAIGIDGHLYGGGGSGTFNDDNQGTTRTGGAGADGLVLIDVYV